MLDEPANAIWDRVLNSGQRTLPAELSRYILQLGLPEEDRERMQELGERIQSGRLSDDERAELEAYSHAAAFLTILQSKARYSLRASLAI